MSFVKEVSTALRSLWENARQGFAHFNDGDDKSIRNTILLIVLAGAVFGGYKGYRWHISNREANAQRAFTDATQLFQQASADPKKWSDVAGAFDLGYEQNKNSNLAPFFLFFKAEAVAQQMRHPDLYTDANTDDVVSILETGLKELPSSDPFYNFYKTKLALNKIDAQPMSADTTSEVVSKQDDGLKELESLAHDEKNGARDMALYYLGSYYWDKNELSKAREVWQILADLPVGNAKSPYVQLIQDRLDQIG